MRDHMALGTALQDRFSWSVFPSSPSSDRKVFDTACETWAQWEHQQRQTPYGYSPQSNRSMNSDATSTLILDDVFAQPYTASEPDHLGAQIPVRRSGNPNTSPRGRPTTAGSTSQVSVASPSTAPTRRLSRSMRVFVAWKP